MTAIPRTAFWLGSILSIWLAWELWFAWWLARRWPWRRILFVGLILMIAVVPLQVYGLLRLFGHEPAPLPQLLLRCAAIVVALVPVALVILSRLRPVPAAPRQPAPNFRGTLIPLCDVAALVAEDHYVRLHLADGSNRLLHRRFRDALIDLAGTPGQQVHRGAWIAEAHRGRARRERERWVITLQTGLAIKVSRSRVADLRMLGWLAREAG